MIDLKTREHLVYFMQCGAIRLSHYDLKFIQNLQSIILTKNSITTNQVNLFEKVVNKYRRQIEKQKINFQKISSLPWTTNIVQSDSYFTDAHVSIKDNVIYLRCPFNKKFLNDLRAQKYQVTKWDRTNKYYVAPYNTFNLKTIITLVEKHFSAVNYCEVIQELLNKLQEFNSCNIWEPTLVKINDRYIIAATNSYLNDAINHLTLSNDIKCLSFLAKHGVSIDNTLLDNNPKLMFAATYYSEFDVQRIDDLIEWLKELKVDGVYFQEITNNFFKNELKKRLESNSINTSRLRIISDSNNIFKNPVLIKFTTSKNYYNHKFLAKVIKLINSNPIDIK